MKKQIVKAVCLISLLLSPHLIIAQVQVDNIAPGAASSFPHCFYPFNGQILFCANNTFNNNQVYISDGTASGTTMLTNIPNTIDQFFNDFNDNGASTYMNVTSGGQFFFYNNKYYFYINPCINSAGTASCGKMNIWQTDGTTAGTYQIDTLPTSLFNSQFFILTNSLGQANLCAFITVLPWGSVEGVINSLYEYNLAIT